MKHNSTIYNISNHKLEFFASNDFVKEHLYQMMPEWIHTILDPCAGMCDLEYLDSDKYQYTLFDIEKRNNYITEVCDFLKRQQHKDEFYDAVVVNPPFNYTNEFVEKCFKYTNDIFLIAPLKSTFKDYRGDIVNYYGHWTIPFGCYKVLTSIAIFHLHRDNEFIFGGQVLKNDRIPKLPIEKTLKYANFNYIDRHIENKPFIVSRITKARILRNEPLIDNDDIYEAGDDSAFIATATSANKKTIKGDRIFRNIKYFNTKEDAIKFKKWFEDNDEYVRNYCYTWGSNLIALSEIPYF